MAPAADRLAGRTWHSSLLRLIWCSRHDPVFPLPAGRWYEMTTDEASAYGDQDLGHALNLTPQ